MMEDKQIQKEIQSQNQLTNDEIISWGQLLSEAKDTLTKANVPDADIDAWLLMEHCFSITKSFFFLNRRQIVESKEKIKQYREFIKQRAARIPLQYLTKTQGFMGLEFSVTPAVLIPRQDTETLVETRKFCTGDSVRHFKCSAFGGKEKCSRQSCIGAVF